MDTRRRRVLVVDDDRHIRGLLKLVLEVEGYDVELAADGAAALVAFAANPPDCVVVDVVMPELDGYDVLRGIRASAHAAVPVVMMTATAGDEQAWRAWSDGVDYFLPKPFDPDELLRFLAYLFKQQMVRTLGA